MIDNDSSTPLLQVRLIIGDSSAELMSDATINALLTINSDDVNKTALQALTAIVADLAKQVNEEVGDVRDWASDRYKQYRDLLDKITKDPSYLLNPVTHRFGGTSVAEVNRVNNDSDSRGPGIKQGEFTSGSLPEFNPYNINFLQ